MIKIDRTTSIHSRGKFARICVEIDLAKKLVPKISVMGSELNVEYKGLHQICFACGKYGHRADMCTKAPTNEALQPKITREKDSNTTYRKKVIMAPDLIPILEEHAYKESLGQGLRSNFHVLQEELEEDMHVHECNEAQGEAFNIGSGPREEKAQLTQIRTFTSHKKPIKVVANKIALDPKKTSMKAHGLKNSHSTKEKSAAPKANSLEKVQCEKLDISEPSS
ncbi:hypothetical protein AHAS_Ahas06G0121200 [Arachis hypogaea]